MFVLSQEQICQVLRKKPEDFRGKLLDIGAGDGNVTGKMAHFMDHVTTTEVSGPMVKNLNNKGFNCIQTFDLNHEKLISGGPYKVISLLNVLDRADKPLTMLRQIRSLLDPQYGVLLLAVVLPFSAFVEVGTQKLPPSEILPMRGGLCAEGASFEDAANVLLKNVLIPNGFKLRTFSRVPYLCRGDLQQPYYVLCDGIFVLEVDPNFSTGVTTN
jgi:SAM-dependent methyltransferase